MNELYNRRKELGLTLEQVGDACGVGKSTVRKWENGIINNMGRDKIVMLSKVLKVSPLYILNMESDKPLSPFERRMISYMEKLNNVGKEEAEKRIKELTYIPEYRKETTIDFLQPVAAHERTDTERTEEGRKHDDDLMNDESIWGD